MDSPIATLKAALTIEGTKQAVFDPTQVGEEQPIGPQVDAGLFSAARSERNVFGPRAGDLKRVIGSAGLVRRFANWKSGLRLNQKSKPSPPLPTTGRQEGHCRRLVQAQMARLGGRGSTPNILDL